MARPEAVLVTGGAGFVGSALCRTLAAAGARVVVYDSLRYGADRLRGLHGCELVEGDVRDASALARVLEAAGPCLVYHLAALHFIPYCEAHPEEARDVNVGGTRALLAACAAARPARVVLASSGAVYPAQGSPFGEDARPGPLDVYGATKLEAEEELRRFGRDAGVATVAARLFNVFGPGETNPHLIPDILAQVEAGHSVRLGNLEPVRDYVHVDDVASALAALGEVPAAGTAVYNVGAGQGRSVRQVMAAIAAAVPRPLEVASVSERSRRNERAALVADVTRIRRDTAWSPRVAFEDGIRDLVAARGLA